MAVCVRPENVVLLAGIAPADNVVEGHVLERLFLGRQVRLVVEAAGQRIVAIIPSATAAQILDLAAS